MRDRDGYFVHPVLRHFCTSATGDAEHCTKEQWAVPDAQASITMSIYFLESGPEDYPAVLTYRERDEGVLLWKSRFEPGWWLIEIGDSEEGAYTVSATFA
ncbi:hypothetical protein WS98_24950 [Burkholderia territorii]|uniref:hypothetical protein n=1 Tax=Burkholderia territorii TaxID=1503055 RepID=UPI000751B813|nr:hypothetical protein [Burkholderia territorii]KVL29683.1 hypothetical protein WS98_24950 [Burkholderia territorii]KWH15932.1 hypothetical protein WT59_09115 [Burkholderia territorii]